MTNKYLILSSLSSEEICDDCLSETSGVKPRQTVYAICRDLHKESSILRHQAKCHRCRKVKLSNRLSDKSLTEIETAATSPAKVVSHDEQSPWFWEGNVQAKVISYLVQNGCSIRSAADTASRAQGKDIVALAPDGRQLWISVKGFPEKSPNTQARHWFSGAIFDLVLYRGESSEVSLAIALPDGFITYANLSPRISWLKDTMPFEIYWVSENGEVRVE